jgi:hypothetical protein
MFSPAASLLLLAFFALFRLTTAAAVPLLNHQIEEHTRHDDAVHPLNRRQNTNSSGFTIVTGIQGASPQPRLEIRQLEKNADQWNIYLLGMRRFMSTNQSEKLSYYQIAGKLFAPHARQPARLIDFRNPREALRSMGRRWSSTRRRCTWLLRSSFTIVHSLAQAVHGALRGLFSDAQNRRQLLTSITADLVLPHCSGGQRIPIRSHSHALRSGCNVMAPPLLGLGR